MYDSGSLTFALLSFIGVYYTHPENPKHLNLIYWGFYLSLIVQFFTLVATLVRINSANDNTPIPLNNQDVAVFPPFLAFLAPKPGTSTYRQYDLFKLRVKLVTSILYAAFSYLVAVLFDAHHMLVFAALVPIGHLYFSNELVSIHIYGQTEADDRNLKRPFKQVPMNPIAAFKQLIKETKKDLAASGFKIPGASSSVKNKDSKAASPSANSAPVRGAGQPRRVVRT